jgi:hypothetical protein
MFSAISTPGDPLGTAASAVSTHAASVANHTDWPPNFAYETEQTVTTTDGTVTPLDFPIPEDTTWHYHVFVVARRTDGGNQTNGYRIRGCVTRWGAGAALDVGASAIVEAQQDEPAWSTAAAANGNNLRVTVTGGAAQIFWRVWVARWANAGS